MAGGPEATSEPGAGRAAGGGPPPGAVGGVSDSDSDSADEDPASMGWA